MGGKHTLSRRTWVVSVIICNHLYGGIEVHRPHVVHDIYNMIERRLYIYNMIERRLSDIYVNKYSISKIGISVYVEKDEWI